VSRYRVYIKPFVSPGVYAEEYTDISSDVISIGSISRSLDNSTYDIGIFKTSGVNIKLRNDHGKYSAADTEKSIFSDKRQDSLIQITWDVRSTFSKAGFFKCGDGPLSSEVVIFDGLLSEISSIASIDDQDISFRFAGFDSLLSRVEVPFSSISNGDTFSGVIYTMLNQSPITDYLTVDQANIVCAVDEGIDDKSNLENKTVREALDSGDLLLAASSVLYIQDGVIYVQSREETVDSQYTFFGQASINGIENIIDIKNFRDGINRVFNFVKWQDTALKSTDATSIAKYGVQQIELSVDVISDASTSKIQNILDEIKNDFRDPKIEFELETSINNQVIELMMKDKVLVDYPTVYRSADENVIPRYGLSAYGQARYPVGQYSLVINAQTTSFKIMAITINPSKDTMIFNLREN